MSIAPTHRHTLARHYRRPGGPWDVGTLDAVLSSARPRDDLLVDGDVRLSSLALNHAVARLAGGLRAMGVRRRHAVAWQLPNRWEAVALYRACWRLGAVAVPVHHLAGAADVERMLGAVGPHHFVHDEQLAALLAADPLAPSVRSARPFDPAAVLFTSGSSGAPKGVIHTHRGLAYKAKLMARVHGLKRRDAILMPAPLAHISGLLNGILVPGVRSMRTVVMAKWDPDSALGIVERERVSFMIGPPTFFVGLRGARKFSPAAVESLRLISCGGAGVTPDFVAETAAAFDARVKRTYGSTEAPTITTAHAGDPKKKARRTDGRPTGEVELRLDPVSGELLVRAPELFAGYTDPARTAEAFVRGGWFRTGDRAAIDDGGWLTITGRLKDVIIRGGENIATADVEAHCEAHPSVRAAVAAGYPDDRLGERVGVAVVVTPGARFDVAECQQWFAARGATRFTTPERVVVVPELPVLAAGKPDRVAVARLLTAAT